nr:UDP-N-acetylmuramoyl-L-alanine--D-glutamate ligase [uncultured Anaeromusa sp.]
MEIAAKKAVVLGAGVSGVTVAKALRRVQADVTLVDGKKAEELSLQVLNLANEGIHLQLGAEAEECLEDADFLVVSPGIPLKAAYVSKAQQRGIPVVSEVEIAYQLCKAPMLAITGTNGKTTTTTLLGEMIKAGGFKTAVGGNIGAGLSEQVLNLGADDMAVAEISSYQLESVQEFHPYVAAVLNVTPDHLERHGTVAQYGSIKERVFNKQGPEDVVVLNYDDPMTRDMAKRAPGRVLFFSRLEVLPEGAFVRAGKMVIRWQGAEVALFDVTELDLPGAHNVENVLAAAAMAYVAGVAPSVICQVLRFFEGVEHRIELVAEVDGVKYYNDSKATNPESTIKALEAFDSGILLLAGGKDKNTDLQAMMKLVKDKVRHLVLFGAAAERFEAAAQQAGVQQIRRVSGVEEAVQVARTLAQPSEVILLSPACSSFDQFSSFEERGRFFKQCVATLEAAAGGQA